MSQSAACGQDAAAKPLSASDKKPEVWLLRCTAQAPAAMATELLLRLGEPRWLLPLCCRCGRLQRLLPSDSISSSAAVSSVLLLSVAVSCSLPPALCHPLSATRSLPPALCHPLSATRSLPPALCHPLSATRSLPPALCHPLSAALSPPPFLCTASDSAMSSSRSLTARLLTVLLQTPCRHASDGPTAARLPTSAAPLPTGRRSRCSGGSLAPRASGSRSSI